MRARYNRSQRKQTYMSNIERCKPAFIRPKRNMLSRKEYKKAIQVKLLGLTLANGQHMECIVSLPFDSDKWMKLIKRRVVPFVKKELPKPAMRRIV